MRSLTIISLKSNLTNCWGYTELYKQDRLAAKYALVVDLLDEMDTARTLGHLEVLHAVTKRWSFLELYPASKGVLR